MPVTPEKKIEIIEATCPIDQPATVTEARKLRVCAYARVSTEQDEQESSYEAQVDYYTNYIQSNSGWEFCGVYADRGISGTNTKYREGFNNMIATALAGGIDLILTKSISRFARNTVDTLQIVRKLKERGVEVIFEKENLHTFDPKCEVMLTIMSSLAQEESRSISENVRWGKRKSMQDGKVSLAYSSFLGYRKGEDGRPEIVEEEAQIVREIYDSFLAGYSIRAIAESLTSRGIPTPMGKKNWSVSTIRSILSNEKYRGDALLQKTYTTDYLSKKVKKNNGELPSVLVHNSHEPIIDPATYDRVQALLQEQQATKSHSRHPFVGKIICGDCGGYYGHKVWRLRSTGKHYDVWYCNHKYNGDSCHTPRLKEAEVIALYNEVMKKCGKAYLKYSPENWQDTIKTMVVHADGRVEFLLVDGEAVSITYSPDK